jgi:hypothetical protein
MSNIFVTLTASFATAVTPVKILKSSFLVFEAWLFLWRKCSMKYQLKNKEPWNKCVHYFTGAVPNRIPERTSVRRNNSSIAAMLLGT